MAPRRVVAIGVELHSDVIDQIQFNSKHTLLDWDLAVFLPDISDMVSYRDSYQGKVCLDEGESFRLKERCEHWRREIKLALDAGRTVICYLEELKEIFVDTGERTHSGTGRNRNTTRLVSPYSNYECLPFSFMPRNASGSAMKLSPDAYALAPYWTDFGRCSRFEVTLNGSKPKGGILTKTGDQIVGGTYRTATGGNFVALPMLDFYPESFFDDDEFNDDARAFAGKLVHSWLALDAALRSDSELTPAPQWTGQDEYSLDAELALRAALLEAEQRLIDAQKRKEEAADALLQAGVLRALLYEKGTPLENAIIRALTMLGFKAEAYKDSDSQFDVVFCSSEGRLLGEAEGKDSKAINIEKLRQLSMNVHEDFAREEVTTPAKPILFGNGFRLQAPADRDVQFTAKCIASATTSGTGLVATADLFRVAKYISDTADPTFAALCRDALLKGTGLISFPAVPATFGRTTLIGEVE